MHVTIERGPALLTAGAVIVAGSIIGAGGFLGGYYLGEAHTPPPQPLQTELAEKTFTVDDLEAALTSCQIEGVSADTGSVTLLGDEHPPMKRQCFVVEMGASTLADREYSYGAAGTNPADRLERGEYTWSNVHMVWEQTGGGRDVTITVR